MPRSRKYSATAVATCAPRTRSSGERSHVAATTTERGSAPDTSRSCTSQPRSPMSPTTVTSAFDWSMICRISWVLPTPAPAKMPTQMAATAAVTTMTAVLSEWAAKRDGGSVEPSRTAAIGGTRVARRAGTTLASSVITVPSASETRTVRSANTIQASGRSPPTAVSNSASPNPAKSPTTEASSPITTP